MKQKKQYLFIDVIAHILLDLLEIQIGGRSPFRLGQNLHGHHIVVHGPVQVPVALDKHGRILGIIVQEHVRLQVIVPTRLETALEQLAYVINQE